MTGYCIFNGDVECGKHDCTGCPLWETEGKEQKEETTCNQK